MHIIKFKTSQEITFTCKHIIKQCSVTASSIRNFNLIVCLCHGPMLLHVCQPVFKIVTWFRKCSSEVRFLPTFKPHSIHLLILSINVRKWRCTWVFGHPRAKPEVCKFHINLYTDNTMARPKKYTYFIVRSGCLYQSKTDKHSWHTVCTKCTV